MSQTISKPNYNEEFRICDFTPVLDAADTVTAGEVKVWDKAGTDLSADMISNVSVHTGNKALRYKLMGGITGKRYTMEVRISTASLQKFEEPFVLVIT